MNQSVLGRSYLERKKPIMMQINTISIKLQQDHSIVVSSLSKDLFISSCLALLKYIIFFYLYSNLSVILLFNYRSYYNSFSSFLCYILTLFDYFLSTSKSSTDLNILEFDFKSLDLFTEESSFLLLSFDYDFSYKSISIS